MKIEKGMMCLIKFLHTGKLIREMGEDFKEKMKAQGMKMENAVSEGKTTF